MKKVKSPISGGYFWVRKRGSVYIANSDWRKAILGIASPSIMTFVSQDELKNLFEGKNVDETKEKEAPAMQVTYNGFTGELVKLERIKCPPLNGAHIYDISIYDDENRCTHSFTGVKLEDVKFLGGAVTFDE